MNKMICYLNLKEYIISKNDFGYCYNSKVLDSEEVDNFVNNLIKMCRSIERRKNNSSNNKIEIYFDDEIVTLTGIDLRVINYIKSFLK